MMEKIELYVKAIHSISETFNLDVAESIDFINTLAAILETIAEEGEFGEDELFQLSEFLVKEYGIERATQILTFISEDEDVWADIAEVAIDLKNEIENLDEVVTTVMNILA